MLTLILATLIGFGLAFFSTQNTHGVTITLANYPLTGIPLYLIVLVSMFSGLFIGFVVNLIHSVSSSIKLHGKNVAVHNANQTISDLQKEIDDLQIENNLLKSSSQPSYASRLRHTVGL